MGSSSTEYLVLRRGADGAWSELEGSWLASGAAKARRLAAESTGEDGEYVAVPARSFQSEPFHFENVRRLLPGAGKAAGGLVGGTAAGGTLTGVGTSGGSASA